MPLEAEMATYRRELPNLIAESGKFAVIGGDEVVGVYDTYNDALKVGYDRFQLAPFMVHQIEVGDRVQRFTRDLGLPCPT